MAACSSCGTKVGWGRALCEPCAEKRLIEESESFAAVLRSELPSLLEVLDRNGLKPHHIYDNVRDLLPRDSKYLAIYSGKVFLTDRGIITYDFTITTGRLRASETIPVATITSLELKPPSPRGVDMFTLKLIRAGNEDLEFSHFEDKVVQDFVSKVQTAMAGGNTQSAPSQPSSIERLKSLTELKDQGLISEAEFETKKAAILGDL